MNNDVIYAKKICGTGGRAWDWLTAALTHLETKFPLAGGDDWAPAVTTSAPSVGIVIRSRACEASVIRDPKGGDMVVQEMQHLSRDRAAGVAVPDTKLATEATELVRDVTTDLVYDHSRRVFCFGSLQGRKQGLSFDPELLYIGAMFHDLGLNEQFRRDGRRFEVDSADEAPRVLPANRGPEDSGRRG